MQEVTFKAKQQTIVAWFKNNATTDWTANPSADELWLEIEYFNDTSSATKTILKSSGTVNFTGSTAWQSLQVTFTPVTAGNGWVRVYYRKTKESSKSNYFYTDSTFDFSPTVTGINTITGVEFLIF